MASTEEDAYPIMQSLDVDYVLAVFGGYIGYQSDDINKVSMCEVDGERERERESQCVFFSDTLLSCSVSFRYSLHMHPLSSCGWFVSERECIPM
jgi:hypothetical protein